MAGNIIDASNKFQKQPERASQETHERIEQRRQERIANLSQLRSNLQQDPSRLPPADRGLIVRNLGRLIERRYPDDKNPWASRLFDAAFGNQADSARKKRARYIRFEGEKISGNDQLFATRRDVLRLSDAWAALTRGDTVTQEHKDEVLAQVCDGTSFFEPARPRIQHSRDCLQEFRLRIADMIDRVAKETDIVSYFDEMRRYDVITLPKSKGDLSGDDLFALNVQCFPVNSFEHNQEHDSSFNEDYRRLRLAGYSFASEEPPSLLPRIRLARTYWPRTVLCLDANASAAEVRAAYRNSKMDGTELRLREAALREAGFNSTRVNWDDFIDPRTGAALPGASWRVFWQARSIDLHLTAHDEPEALALGISASDPHWLTAPKSLLQPQDDVRVGAEIDNCVISDEFSDLFAWFPAGERMLVCRGFSEEWLPDEAENARPSQQDLRVEYEDEESTFFYDLMDMGFGPLDAGPAWDLMVHPMQDWQDTRSNVYVRSSQSGLLPALRPLFDAPHGWTPAPDGTLAAALLRSLAYGKGPERIDEKLMAAVNQRVRGLQDMRSSLERKYEAGLAQNGYGRTGEEK